MGEEDAPSPPRFGVRVKTEEGLVIPMEVSGEETIEKLSERIPNINIPSYCRRLISGGKVLEASQTIRHYQIKPDQIIYVLNDTRQGSTNNTTASSATTTSTNMSTSSVVSPTATFSPFSVSTCSSSLSSSSLSSSSIGFPTADFGGLGSMSSSPPEFFAEMINSRDLLSSLLSSPMAQGLLDNPQFLRSILEANPQLRELRERNPELNHILNDPQMLRQSLEMMRNPSLLREMMRSTDRAMSNIEAVPGGFNALRRMYHTIQEPLWDVVDSSTGGPQRPTVRPDYELHSELPPETEALPNPWARGPTASSATGALLSSATLPSVSQIQGLDPNSLAAMMQDPNMQNLVAGMLSSTSRSTTQEGSASTASPAQVSGAVGSLFSPQSLLSMSHLQQAMQDMNMNGTNGGGSTSHSAQPPVDFRTGFTNYIRTQSENPEALYHHQLLALRSMGFTDTQACIQALRETDGNLYLAVDRLLENNGPP